MDVVTYIPDFQVFLTRRCAMRCGYCNFGTTPTTLPPSKKRLQQMLNIAGRLGACQITLTSGEGIEELPEISSTVRYYGFTNWYDYVGGLCRATLARNGRYLFFPQVDIGPIPPAEIPRLRQVAPVVRLLIHSADDSLQYQPAHLDAPDKRFAARMAALEHLGRFEMPGVTGIQVGIGESQSSWVDAARAVSQLNKRYGHIQCFVIKPFFPQRFTRMANHPPVSDEAVLEAIRVVRAELDPSIVLGAELQSRMHLLVEAYKAGARDMGRIVVGTSDHIDFDSSAEMESMHELAKRSKIQLCKRMPFLAGFLRSHELPQHVKSNVDRFQRLSDKVFLAGSASQACA